MTKSENNVTAIITVDDICNHHLYATIKCINMVIGEEIPEPADVAYLMEVMTKVAKQQKLKGKEARDDVMFKLRLDEKSSVAIWHCLNIVLNNEMITAQEQQVFVSQMLSKIAVKLDQLTTLRNSPEEIMREAKASPLQLVE